MFLSVLLIASYHTVAQTNAIDSLLRLLPVSKSDTAAINIYYNLEKNFVGYDLDKASGYLEDGYKIVKKIHSPYYTSRYYHLKASLLTNQSKYDEAFKMCDSAITLSGELFKKEKNNKNIALQCQLDIAQTLVTKGLICAKQYQYNESIQYYLQSIKILETFNDKKNNADIAHIYTSISSNYYELEQYENALEYDKLALPFMSEIENIDEYVVGYLFVADDYSALSKFDSSAIYLDKVRPLIKQLNRPNLNVRFYYILGGIYRKKKQWNSALHCYELSNESARKNKDDFQSLNSSEGLAACNFELGNVDEARDLAIGVLNESTRLQIPYLKIQGLQLLSRIEDKAGNIKKAFQYQTDYIALSDSVNREKTQRLMNETEAKYQSEKKQHEITQLQKDKQIQFLTIKQKSTLNYILIGSLAGLLLLGILLYRNYRQKQQLQQQRITDLEKDRQLTAVEAMLKGQEEERSRLAKDLHDGLGGLLSGVKYSLSNMKDNLIVTPDNMTVFERSLDMLDTSIRELRRVAHNMMPEMLTKFGLAEALKEYCNSINATKILNLKYQSLGMAQRLSQSTEIIIYRIVQELLNNILKHASASEAFVQLIKEENRLSVVVEDNGEGFDPNLAENKKGAGLVNIRSRIEYLKGRLDIHTEHGKGTLINIEFNL